MDKINLLIEKIKKENKKAYLIKVEGDDILAIEGDSMLATKANNIIKEAGINTSMFIKMLE